MVDELKGLSLTMAEELLDEDFHFDNFSTNSYFTNKEIQMEEQLTELPSIITIN